MKVSPVNGEQFFNTSIGALPIGFIPPKKLFGTANAKTIKGELLGWRTMIIYLSPYKHNTEGRNLCPNATQGCYTACLFTAGRGRMKPVEKARVNKADYFLGDRDGFMKQVYKEIFSARKFIQYKKNYPLAIRMNGTSDIPWENILFSPTGKGVKKNIMDWFPDVQFYDYTKSPSRFGKTPKNYDLTFSYAETTENRADALRLLADGYRVAIVFDTKKGTPFPNQYKGFKIEDGDEHDLTFLRSQGVFLGLRAKGLAKKDTSGFVVHLDNQNKIKGLRFPKSGYREKYEVQDKYGYTSYFDIKKSADEFIKNNSGSFLIKQKKDMRLKKGSAEAKRFMAKLRASRGKKSSNKNVAGWKKGSTWMLERGEYSRGGSAVKVTRRKSPNESGRGTFKSFKRIGEIPMFQVGHTLYELEAKIIRAKEQKKNTRLLSDRKVIQRKISLMTAEYKSLHKYHNLKAKSQ